MQSILLAALLLAAPSTEMRAIVLTGAKLPERAQLEPAKAKLTTLIPAPGYPKIFESKKIEGLKPGFEVVVLGFCPLGQEVSIADLIEAEAKRQVPGAYGRAVRTSEPASCPRLKFEKPDEADGIKAWDAYQRAPESPDAMVEYGHYLVSVGDLDGAEYLGQVAYLRGAKHAGAKGLLEKVGLLQAP